MSLRQVESGTLGVDRRVLQHDAVAGRLVIPRRIRPLADRAEVEVGTDLHPLERGVGRIMLNVQTDAVVHGVDIDVRECRVCYRGSGPHARPGTIADLHPADRCGVTDPQTGLGRSVR